MAKKHIVKCAVCGEQFDLNTVQGVRFNSRRYAHKHCFPSGEEVPLFQAPETDKDYVELKDYIIELFGATANWALINKQIKNYLEVNNYSYSGIRKSLNYFFKVKGNPIEKANGGIGIVPFVYQDAYNYYFAIWEAQQRNETFTMNMPVQPQVVEIHIPSPKRQPVQEKKRLFTFLEEEDAFEEGHNE